jgi:hypothetical protein
MNEPVGIKTSGRILFRDADNKVYKTMEIHNLITNAGRQWIIKQLRNASAAVIQDMELGSNSTPATVLDTGVTSLVLTRAVTITDDFANRKFTVAITMLQNELLGTVISELAIKLDDGSCFNHSVFTAWTKGVPSVDFEFDIQYP